MNDVRPKVTLLVHTPEPIEVCKRAAGVCVGNPAGSMAGLKHAIKSGHESVLEHVSFTFQLQDVSRVLLAQLTRHRIASYSVESQRYVSYKDGFKVHIPMDSYELCTMPELMDLYEAAMTYSENIYKQLLEAGVDAEVARYVMPNAATTTIVVTMNARELRHFFRMRCCNRAQAEIRYVAREMLKLCEGVAYELFEDAGPACKVGPCKETKPCGNPIYAMPCTTPIPEDIKHGSEG